MAFDGIVIANLVRDIRTFTENGRISKIAQPEADELLITLKGPNGQVRLVLSASASLPLVYLTDQNKPSPLTAPAFCMLLRKHIGNARITAVHQPGMERIINFELEHLNELGDLCRKTLVVELMGKHSNIIFCDDTGRIIDSIKHISGNVSSVREVLPGRQYFIPKTQEKSDPRTATREDFFAAIKKPLSLGKAIYTSFNGLSPAAASELCFRASLDSDAACGSLDKDARLHLYQEFSYLMEDVRQGNFAPNIIKNGREPVDFSAIPMTQYQDYERVDYPSISQALEVFYAQKNVYTRIRQKSSDLRRIVGTALDRNRKKYDLQQKQLKDTEKREKYKVYGELLHTYGYGLAEGARELTAFNYYTSEDIRIPLDPQLTAAENAQKYYDRYNKQKRTFEALSELVLETRAEILHLESVAAALDIAVTEDDLAQIRQELAESGYIKKRSGTKKEKIKSRPFHYLSSDGFHMYVGKNNFQNDELTFKFANGGDWWFHAKGMPGSHVVVKTEGKELPDRAFEEAGRLAAYYSSGRGSEKIEIDYVRRKEVKKPGGSKPGFVVYYTNYSLTIDSDISALTLVES